MTLLFFAAGVFAGTLGTLFVLALLAAGGD